MAAASASSLKSLGADLRSLRKARGQTLAYLAEQVDKSVGWLSQVERDISQPSIDDLRALAAVLDVSISVFFGQNEPPADKAGFVVRYGARRPLGSGEAGLVEELLASDLTDDCEMLHSTFEPSVALRAPISRPTQEVGYLLSGKLDMVIAGKAFTVHPGDSSRIRGEAVRYANHYITAAVAI